MRKIINVGFLLAAVFVLPPFWRPPLNMRLFTSLATACLTRERPFPYQASKNRSTDTSFRKSSQNLLPGSVLEGPVAAEYLWRQLRDESALVPFLSNLSIAVPNRGINSHLVARH